MSGKHKNEEAIFKSAIKLKKSAERIAYVKDACGDDSELLARITSLLKAHDGRDNVLDALIDDVDVTLDNSPISEGPGTVIGRYKLLEQIGEGGMAVVYMAEQERPLHRKVALKIIKLGMDTNSVVARFEVERQALAMMEHPNIAKVLDAGATETGRPYFVMELVRGVSITDYCDKNNLNTKERLDLFISVCNAVQHAHHKGIIHRDIKPSNIMVTLRDGKPVPKVIDFGIAKATSQRLTEKTVFTQYAQMIGTPAYMSPEQAEFSELDIDTRTDIYSLGVMLYELLTGTTPHDEEKLREAGYLEMQRIILEEDPPRPSTKLSTLGETITDIAKHRSSTPDLLRKAIRGDLDWIVMKTLEKGRDRRYDTVSALAMDVERHINDEPILARAPSTIYLLQKFLRRHRFGTVAALVVSVFLVALFAALLEWRHNKRLFDMEESLRHINILSQARRLYTNIDMFEPLVQVKSILDSKHVGPEAQILYDYIIADARKYVSNYTRKIEADPEDAESYLRRARYYHCLDDKASALADMVKYVGIYYPSEGMDSNGLSFRDLLISLWQSTPTNLGPTVNSPSVDGVSAVSADGLSLFFDSDRPGGYGGFDIWMTTRPSVSDPWGIPVNLGPQINTEFWDGVANLSTDGLSLFFSSDRPGVHGESYDIWVSTRETTGDPWGTPANLGPPINSADCQSNPCISADGLSLYFSSGPSPHIDMDIWVTTRPTTEDDWGTPENLGPTVNSPHLDVAPRLLADDLILFFTSWRPGGGYGGRDIWVTARKTRDAEWGTPVNLGPPLNSSTFDHSPIISPDGSTLYFSSGRPGGYGGYDIWQVPIIPMQGDNQKDGDPNFAPTSVRSKDGKEVVTEKNQ